MQAQQVTSERKQSQRADELKALQELYRQQLVELSHVLLSNSFPILRILLKS